MSEGYDDLAKRVATLEAELAKAKKALEAVKPEEPFVPRLNMQKIDWTEGMSMSGPAMKAMVDLVNPKDVKYDPNAWARNRIGEPGGFGPPPKGMAQADKALRQREREEEKLRLEREARRREEEPEKVGSAIERALAPWRNKPY